MDEKKWENPKVLLEYLLACCCILGCSSSVKDKQRIIRFPMLSLEMHGMIC